MLAVTLDAAANCKLGRKIASKNRKDILSSDCVAHLVALITGIIFNVGETMYFNMNI